MPRVHYVKKARKDNGCVSKGESYYWWKFRYGSKCMSKKPPKASQLTQSEFLSTVYDINERIEECACDSLEDLEMFPRRDQR